MDKGNLQNDVRSVSVLNFYPLIHTFMNAQLVMRLIWWRDKTVKGAEKNVIHLLDFTGEKGQTKLPRVKKILYTVF